MQNLTIKTKQVKGFTLIEIMTVVVIIGVLGALAVPAVLRADAASKATALAGSLETLSGGALNYAMEKGEWAPASTNGILPSELHGYISEVTFESEPPTGGQWIIDSGTDFTFAIGVSSSSSPDETFVKIDEINDDGDLTTGAFRKTAEGTFFLIIEE